MRPVEDPIAAFVRVDVVLAIYLLQADAGDAGKPHHPIEAGYRDGAVPVGRLTRIALPSKSDLDARHGDQFRFDASDIVPFRSQIGAKPADLLDLVVRVPTERTGGRSQTFTRSFGAVTLVVEVRDSESGEILARAGDRRDPASMGAGNVSEVSPSLVKADTQRLFRYWAEIMKERLDELREVEG